MKSADEAVISARLPTREENRMNPITDNLAAHVRAEALLAMEAQEQYDNPLRRWLRRTGDVLTTLGQKMMDAAQPTLDEQTAAVSAENC
jgi:hypothetical protein